MANHMSTALTIGNLDEQSYNKLKEIFNDGKTEYYTDINHIISKMYGDVDNIKLDWWIDNIGAKWLEVESAVTEEFQSEVQLYMTSAWNVPVEFLEKLRDILTDITKDVVLYGTYEDESLEPIGAFVYGHGYDDIEDLDIEIDFDKYWDDDDLIAEEYRESVFDELFQHKDNMYRLYLDTIEEEHNVEH